MFGIFTIMEQTPQSGKGILCTTETICGARYFHVRVAPRRFFQKRRMEKAVREMARAKVRRALFPSSYLPLFQTYHIAPADDRFLRRAMSAAITRRAMMARGITPAMCRAAVLSHHMDNDVQRALADIAQCVRYTMTGGSMDSTALCDALRRDYGICVMRHVSEEQLRYANVVLTFGTAKPMGAPNCLWLPFGSVTSDDRFRNGAAVVEYDAPPEIEAALTAFPQRNELLSFLLQSGVLRKEDITVRLVRSAPLQAVSNDRLA